MSVSAGVIAKAAAMLLSNEKTRKGLGWIVVAILSPTILIAVVLCSMGTGTADHNNHAVKASFYGATYSDEIPADYKVHVEDMRTAFSLLDSAVASVNASAADGIGLDPLRVKAVFYALCFGEDAPSRRAATRFVKCFYAVEERTRTIDVTADDDTITTETETYTVTVPLSMESAYTNLASELGRAITEDDKENVNHIYYMIAGGTLFGAGGAYLGGGTYDGSYTRGDGSSIEIDVSAFVDPSTKNAADLVTYAINAYENGWGYVWGTYGSVLTDSLFAYKLEQYPDGVGNHEDFIR
ncbi:MAG: hypothetical protein ACI3YM_04345, partial [Prevotella sp.]